MQGRCLGQCGDHPLRLRLSADLEIRLLPSVGEPSRDSILLVGIDNTYMIEMHMWCRLLRVGHEIPNSIEMEERERLKETSAGNLLEISGENIDEEEDLKKIGMKFWEI
ncbi:hypothetical protein HAX54_016682 [Datura stramonium]|uniref:Uncharacterized protein n=1 Tax=Datura stramonium TaxID=4076 RepID=A0ABS8UJA3_DATST|nr:hypothetical protein [Datura stramonium]